MVIQMQVPHFQRLQNFFGKLRLWCSWLRLQVKQHQQGSAMPGKAATCTRWRQMLSSLKTSSPKVIYSDWNQTEKLFFSESYSLWDTSRNMAQHTRRSPCINRNEGIGQNKSFWGGPKLSQTSIWSNVKKFSFQDKTLAHTTSYNFSTYDIRWALTW